MSDLFWPGDERAGSLLSDHALVTAMVAVEQAWLDVLAENGTADERISLVAPDDLEALARAAAAGGNPVQPLVEHLRGQSPWVHRGLTSQDVLDTALMLCLRDVLLVVQADLGRQVRTLQGLAAEHRGTTMAGRTLTQHAVPITFGLKAAGWLSSVLDAFVAVVALRQPVQVGGAAGTLAAIVELTGSASTALEMRDATARRLGLVPAPSWHTTRQPVTAIGDALVTCTDAWGRIATDVATLSRPELGELAEPDPGTSSTMPHKQNPVLSVLIRRAAVTGPPLAAILHSAAALAGDERPDGAWHAEWATLRDLGRRTIVAGSQATDLLSGLRIDADRMGMTARASWDDLTAERSAVAGFAGADPGAGDYLGAVDPIIDAVLSRAEHVLDGQEERR